MYDDAYDFQLKSAIPIEDGSESHSIEIGGGMIEFENDNGRAHFIQTLENSRIRFSIDIIETDLEQT
jgi:hypothetical protein